jgi:4'-phosphopantetheinyl transferase
MSSAKISNKILYPVILEVPAEIKAMQPRERVVALSRHARSALAKSAEISGLPLSEAVKNDQGVPQPVGGVYWSVTHKPDFVAAVVSRSLIGIDIEKIRSCAQGLFRKTASASEWELAAAERSTDRTFFRYWTAKEAVLKTFGRGIADLSKCRVHRLIDEAHLEIEYRNAIWLVEHCFYRNHIASLVKNRSAVAWSFF